VHASLSVDPDAWHVRHQIVMVDYGAHGASETVNLGCSRFLHHALNALLVLLEGQLCLFD
jgi:hypothetical protein